MVADETATKSGLYRGSLTSLLVLAVTVNTAWCMPETTRAETAGMIYDWNKIVPSTDLNWVPCFNDYICTRLEVPLDYGNRRIGTTPIPFIKSLAKVQPAPNVVINFGGPGESGIELLQVAADFRRVYGEANNFVSFDPRGVNASEILLSCFPDAPGISTLADQLNSGASQAPQSDADAFYRAQAYTQRCNKYLGEGSNTTARYASTPAVATDMLSYIEAEARAAKQDPSQAKLRFIGYSYGTLLGQTYAAMFPDRIERMILDGNADGERYYRGIAPARLTQVDAGIEGFFTYCHRAGPKKCAFYRDSPDAISKRLQDLFSQLDIHPLPVGDPGVTQIPTLANAFQLSQLIFTSLYSPLDADAGFESLAEVMLDLENRNGTSLIQAGPYNLAVDFSRAVPYDEGAAGPLIICMDNYKHRVPMTTLTEYEQYLEELRNESAWVAVQLASTRTSCVGLEIVPPPSGQFKGPLPPSAPRTSFAILFANNNRDPATPSTDAQKMSKAFPGSVVVLQDAIGHTTLSAPSECLYRIYRAYMGNGTLPQPNTICQPNELPFGLRA